MTVWEGGIRVPCVMRWPARLPAGKATRQPAITMDLTATILAATGTQPPADRKLDGINLLPLLEQDQPVIERTFCWRVERTARHQKAIRHGQWKFVQDDMVEMLFDLENDVSERHDLFYRKPEIVRDLKRRLAAWEADVASSKPAFVVK
jgi:arylsulfatase A-like enzyme